MKQQADKQAHVLDRVMYLLEEGSVGYLAEKDESFAEFIDTLYQTVDAKATRLRRQAA
jgi:hypothetical protein